MGSGEAIAEAAIAVGPGHVPAGGGSVVAGSIDEILVMGDAVSAAAAFPAGLAEGLALDAVAIAPGGAVSDGLSDSIDLSAIYAASTLWTIATPSSPAWAAVDAAEETWITMAPTGGIWTKH